MIKIISHAVVTSYFLIHYSVPKGTGNYYLLLYSHFGVPTARQHVCLLYHIPKGMFHQFSLSISCPTNQKNLLIRKNIAAKQRIGKFIHKIAFCLQNIWIVLHFAITLHQNQAICYLKTIFI